MNMELNLTKSICYKINNHESKNNKITGELYK